MRPAKLSQHHPPLLFLRSTLWSQPADGPFRTLEKSLVNTTGRRPRSHSGRLCAPPPPLINNQALGVGVRTQ